MVDQDLLTLGISDIYLLVVFHWDSCTFHKFMNLFLHLVWFVFVDEMASVGDLLMGELVLLKCLKQGSVETIRAKNQATFHPQTEENFSEIFEP